MAVVSAFNTTLLCRASIVPCVLSPQDVIASIVRFVLSIKFLNKAAMKALYGDFQEIRGHLRENRTT